MGRVIDCRDLKRGEFLEMKFPVIFVSPPPRWLRESCEQLALNLPLAEKLCEVPPEQRAARLSDEVHALLYAGTKPLLLERYEMLFSPAYRLNVLKLFSDAARIRPFYAVWPGTFRNNTLIYAEKDDPEYKTYKITNCDVLCVL